MLLDPGEHAAECPVLAQRRDLLAKLSEDPTNPYLLGALVEYYGMGDQESEGCTCGYDPVARLARVILDNSYDEHGQNDHTAVYEALQSILDQRTFKRLGAALELCPVHCCDMQICLDDQVHGYEVYA